VSRCVRLVCARILLCLRTGCIFDELVKNPTKGSMFPEKSLRAAGAFPNVAKPVTLFVEMLSTGFSN